MRHNILPTTRQWKISMDLLSLIASGKIILLDGATGTELDKHGLMSRGENNLTAPEIVMSIHRDYLQAGSLAVTANTLTMNRIYVETHGVDVDVRAVNRAGVELARQAAGQDRFVLGNLCSTGQLLEPYGTYTETQFYDTFAEQAGYIAEGGANGFLIETMFDVREAICALRACKDNSQLPVMVSMAFSTMANGGRTPMGDSAEDCAKKLADSGADVVGANCGSITPSQTAELAAIMKAAVSVPILAQPNAGTPTLVEGKTVFDATPETFAEGIAKCIQAGATIVGGCCGTTPEHIRAVAEMLGAE